MRAKILKRMISIICAVGISASCATGFVSAVGGNSKNGGKAVPTTNIKDESDSFWEDYHLCQENIELILDRPEYGVKENAEYIRKKLASNVKTAEQTIEEKKKKEKERLRKVQENKKKLQELEKKKIEKIKEKHKKYVGKKEANQGKYRKNKEIGRIAKSKGAKKAKYSEVKNSNDNSISDRIKQIENDFNSVNDDIEYKNMKRAYSAGDLNKNNTNNNRNNLNNIGYRKFRRNHSECGFIERNLDDMNSDFNNISVELKQIDNELNNSNSNSIDFSKIERNLENISKDFREIAPWLGNISGFERLNLHGRVKKKFEAADKKCKDVYGLFFERRKDIDGKKMKKDVMICLDRIENWLDKIEKLLNEDITDVDANLVLEDWSKSGKYLFEYVGKYVYLDGKDLEKYKAVVQKYKDFEKRVQLAGDDYTNAILLIQRNWRKHKDDKNNKNKSTGLFSIPERDGENEENYNNINENNMDDALSFKPVNK